MNGKKFTELLRAHSLRATPGRLALLAALKNNHRPITAEELHAKLSVDLVTVYRTLQHLVGKKIVREVRLKDSSVRYELTNGEEHHHHLVCTGCGVIDELPDCEVQSLEEKTLRRSQHFASIEEHALEFFGTCVVCAKR